MRKKKTLPELSVTELIEEDLLNTDRVSNLVIPDLVAAIKELLNRIRDLENQISGFKYDLDGKADKQYRSEY